MEDEFVQFILMELSEKVRQDADISVEGSVLIIKITVEFSSEKAILRETQEVIRNLFTNTGQSSYGSYDYHDSSYKQENFPSYDEPTTEEEAEEYCDDEYEYDDEDYKNLEYCHDEDYYN